MIRIRAISKVVPMTGLVIVLMFGAAVPAFAGNVSASITDTGSSVGIGTTTPGSFKLSVAAPSQMTAFGSTTNGARSLLQFYAKDGGGVLRGRMLGYDPIKQNIVLDAGGDGTANNVVINNAGNVGIGTAKPGAKLQVVGSIRAGAGLTGIQRVLTISDTGNNTAVGLAATGTSGRNWNLAATDAASSGNLGGNPGAFMIYDGTADATRVTIDSAGNVGIGTRTPAAKLNVEGSYPHLILNNPSAGAGDQILFRNAGTAAGFIGHQNSAAKLQFSSKDASVAHMTIDDNGNVGIGTTTPGARLEVAGVGDNVDGLILSQGSGTGYFKHSLQQYMSGNAGESYLTFHINNGANTQRANVLTLKGSGAIGVGTIGPQDKLDVEGGSIVVNRYTGHSASGLYLSSTIGPTHYNWMITAQDRVSDALEFGSSTAPGVTTWAEPVMVIHQSGNVSIGVRDPGAYKLAVKGKIRAEEVVVDTGWADFVFKKDYKLMPLEKVARHIEEAGHLPGIPTEKEVQEKGISIGQIQSKLLQKIEEMTLYVIELKKENDQLKGRISALEKSI